jgi:branched-chain amino acid transport system permease protein
MEYILQLIVNGIVSGAIFSLFAVSFSIIYVPSKIFHFAHGMIFTCGAYFTLLFHSKLGIPIAPAILLSIVSTSLVGIGINWIIYEPLQKREASPLVLLVASLGTYIVLEAIISMFFTSNVHVLTRGAESTFNIVGVYVTYLQLIIVIIILLINSLVALFFLKTEAGLSIRALGADPELAEVYGMSRRKIIYLIFAIGSSLAAIGASLNALNTGTIEPMVGMEALLICFVALVVGGMGNIPGAAAGGFIVGMISHLSVLKFEARWEQIILFVVVIVIMLVKPEGLFTRKRSK